MEVDEANVKLVSKEGENFTVRLAVAKMSELVKSMMDGKCWILFLLAAFRMDVLFCARLDLDSNMEEDGDDGISEIPLPNVKSQVLVKVIEFCEHHLQEPMTEIEKPLKSSVMADVVQKWYADFVDLEQVLLFELILAANYMDIKPLLDLTCATVASMIKGKTPDDIRATFNIMNDFSPEEEAQVREENRWCEEA